MKRIYCLILLLSLFINDSLIAQNQGFSCGVKDDKLSEETLKAMRMAPAWLAENKSRKAANDLYVCRIGIDIDSDTYTYFDKDTSRIKYEVIKTIERVSKIYESEINTQLVITHINIWKDSKKDPYYGTQDIFALVNKTYEVWGKAPFKNLPVDKVMYLPTKPFVGAGGVAMGHVNVSPWGEVMVIAHELGHNFGSPHTQSCSWPGGAIDFCYPSEGDCYQNSIEYIRGTIMSYCQSALTFHPLCQALMQRDAALSLKKLTKIGSTPALPDTIKYDGNPFILFNSTVGAEDYYYEISQTADFAQVLMADTSQVNAILCPKFKKNTTYYLRTKARNRFGTTNWSNAATIIVPQSILLPPVLKVPESSIRQNNNLFIDNPSISHTLSFDLDSDATNYEIHIFYEFDDYKLLSKSYSSIRKSGQVFSFSPYLIGAQAKFFWRVRAINEQITGSWSELQTVNFIQKDNTIVFPIYNLNNEGDMPLNFPLFYWGNRESYDVKFTISANNNFSNPVTEKLVKANKFSREPTLDYSIMSNKLAPDTEYFLKVETIPQGNSGAVFRTIIKKFRTESTDIANQYKILKHDNTPNLGRVLNAISPSEKGVFIRTGEGISRVNVNTLTAEVFNRDNTDGAISNSGGVMSTDSSGNLWIITRLGKRTGGYDGAFPKPVYALRKFDRNTMALLSSQDFVLGNGMRYYTSIDADNQIIFTDSEIGKIENGVLNALIDFGDQFLITSTASSKSYAWLTGINYQRSKYEVKRYNTATKQIEDITLDNDYDVQSIVVDKQENLWAIFNGMQGIGRFDGAKWTIYNLNNSPLYGYGFSISADRFNNVYVASQSPKKIFQFKNGDWKELDGISKIGFNNIAVDQLGKIWSIMTSNTLIRFDPCKQIIKPTIIGSAERVEQGKLILLEASGCNSVVWNWKNKEEEVYEKLISGTNKIEIRPKSATTYRARCYDNGCSGEESSFTINFNSIVVNKFSKNEICLGDSVVLSPAIEGTFDAKNEFSGLLISPQNNLKIALEKVREGFKFKTYTNMPTGKYWLKIASSSPEMVSKDSVGISILSVPTVNISGKYIICVPEKVSLFAEASAGTPPYSFDWRRETSQLKVDNDTITGLDQPSMYKLIVTDSQGCVSLAAYYQLTKIDFSAISIMSDGPTELLPNSSVTLSVPAGYDYQWYINNLVIPGATNPNYIAKEDGIYKVIIRGIECSAEKTITIASITANEPNETDEFNLKVFPNPSEGNFAFEFTLADNKPAELIIFDISGKTIWQKNIKRKGNHIEQVNLSKYPAGAYLLVLQTAQLKRSIKLEKQ